jgi:hypothetical protein
VPDQVAFAGVEADLVTEQPTVDLMPDIEAIQALVEEVFGTEGP